MVSVYVQCVCEVNLCFFFAVRPFSLRESGNCFWFLNLGGTSVLSPSPSAPPFRSRFAAAYSSAYRDPLHLSCQDVVPRVFLLSVTHPENLSRSETH